MACIVMAHIAMAYMVMTCTVMACIVMACIVWVDVLEKNSATRLKTYDYLIGERAHSFPKHMFEAIKKAWEELDDGEQEISSRRTRDEVKAAKELEVQKKRVTAEKKRAQELEALLDPSAEAEVADYYEGSDEELGGHYETIVIDAESDGNHSGDESDRVDFKRSRDKHVEDTARRDEERRRSKMTADEARIAKDPEAVKRNKERDAEPKPTPKQKEAVKKRRKNEDRAEVSRKAAELAKEKEKLKTQQEQSRGLCHSCKKPGHKASQCPHPICSKCGEPGHRPEHCPEAICEGCQAHEMEDHTGHLYHVCPYKDINPFCTFCKGTGHESDTCPKPGCKRAARVAAKSAAKPAVPKYNPNQPGLGFEQPDGAEFGLEDFSMDGEAMTDEMFQQQCEAKRQRVLLIESRKLTLEQVRESARKEAPEKHAIKLKDSPKPPKVKGTPTFGSTI